MEVAQHYTLLKHQQQVGVCDLTGLDGYQN